jgi:hypothetical protein
MVGAHGGAKPYSQWQESEGKKEETRVHTPSD